MGEYLLEEIVRALHDLAEPGSGNRAIVRADSVRKAMASCACHCPACEASEEDEDDVAWG